ncbi:Podocalyxin [Plecturocebus cupreus]
MGFCHISQAGLELLTSGDLPTLASQSAGITNIMSHYVARAGLVSNSRPQGILPLQSPKRGLCLATFVPYGFQKSSEGSDSNPCGNAHTHWVVKHVRQRSSKGPVHCQPGITEECGLFDLQNTLLVNPKPSGAVGRKGLTRRRLNRDLKEERKPPSRDVEKSIPGGGNSNGKGTEDCLRGVCKRKSRKS